MNRARVTCSSQPLRSEPLVPWTEERDDGLHWIVDGADQGMWNGVGPGFTKYQKGSFTHVDEMKEHGFDWDYRRGARPRPTTPETRIEDLPASAHEYFEIGMEIHRGARIEAGDVGNVSTDIARWQVEGPAERDAAVGEVPAHAETALDDFVGIVQVALLGQPANRLIQGFLGRAGWAERLHPG